MRTTPTRFAATAMVAGVFLLAGCRGDGGSAGQAPTAPAPPDATDPAGSLELPELPTNVSDGAEPEAGGETAFDVCELLTPAEVEEALGHPVEVEKVTEIDCSYETTDTDVLDTAGLMVTAQPSLPVTVTEFEQGIELSSGQDAETEQIDGVGDAAILVTVGPDASILHVKAGDAWLSLTGFGPGGLPAETLSELAGLALQQLA